MSGKASNKIRLTADLSIAEVNALKDAGIKETRYDHERSRDGTRQIITLWLIGLLCAIVAARFERAAPLPS